MNNLIVKEVNFLGDNILFTSIPAVGKQKDP